MNPDQVQSAVRGWGGELRELSREEGWCYMQQWREVFAASYHAAYGKWKRGKFDWHILSFEHTRALIGNKAVYEYMLQPLAPFILIFEDPSELPGYWCSPPFWPNLCEWLVDAYIFPEDLAWTVAFTHHQDVYFSRRE